ncbi:ARM repeat-containing protein [Westerdykella ornata]|uniref:ARM repeat-containing protein n=1 Tax=Westerdykella ornata TaxID=318751 RepID=A0A6A6JWG2_WESOR|nr:ARM repeat-containing protein [Westerdykella ornata]KAF2280158.1 ARM repeat-containing protein [Westerdykella ornata]
MDAAALRDRVQSTLDANAAIRQQAELDLKHAEEKPGFTDALLNILEAEQDPGVRLSTVVYLKNRVSKGWSPAEEYSQAKPIPEEEKESFRNRIVPVLVAAPPQVRAQLIPTIQKILSYDFPQRWPAFFDITVQLLNAQDAASVFAGVQCLLAICKIYRFKSGENRADFDKIVAHSFPQLLNIGNSLVNETSLEAGEILRTVLKVYKHAVYFDLPVSLREQGTMAGWCTLFLSVVSKDPPECSLPDDLELRETNHWWKAKKWAYANLNRLYVRYGNPQSFGKTSDNEYAEVAKYFISHFAPEILKVYMAQIEKWVSKTLWLSKASLHKTLNYLDECIKPKAMWDILKPHTDSLIEHLIFPVLCQSDEDLELFETEPQEYLHRKLNFYEEASAPDVAATNFLVTLTKSRRKQTYSVLNFVNGVVNAYEAAPDNEKDPRKKEGALRMIGTLSGVILGKKSPIVDSVEYFFVRHVFPEFRSPHGFLRARACDTLEKFEQMDFKDPNNLLIIYRNILESMADPALPVRVSASLALQPLIRHDVIRENMKQNIPQVMQQLLKLANEVDVDALANVMEDFVEVFAPELTPFAVALSEQLRDTYLRIVSELLARNQSNGDADGEYGDFLDEKSITALGVLQTIGTLILTLESTPDVLHHLEEVLMPVITTTLENKLYDLYNEVFEIIDSCTFAAKAISPTMWRAFELIHRTFKAGAELYLEDMLPALENYVTYGSEMLVQNRSYLEAIVDMVRTIFKDDKVGGVDRICGCKLAEIIMLNIRGHVDDYIPEFIGLACTTLFNDDPKVKSLRTHLMEVVINAIYYNPALALHVLEQNGWTNKFFSLWFSSIDNFTRVHDKKLCISAICALLTINAQNVPVSVQQGWPRLLQGIVRLFQTLPAAEKNREEAKREENFDYADYNEDEEDEWEQDNDWTEEPDEAEDVKDESQAYLEFLNEEAQKFNVGGDDDEDDLEEEGLLETPLDKIEPYGMFKQALLLLQHEQPVLYEELAGKLSPDEQEVVQAAIHHAGEIEQATAQAQAEAQANGIPVVA